jgi:hypothetical protein
MAANSPLAGTVNFTLDGKAYNLVGECTYSVGSVTRESLAGMDQIHGFSEKPRAPFIKVKLRDAGGLTVGDFNQMRDVTVTLDLVNGKTVIGRDMWEVEAEEVNTEDATFDVKWEGAQDAVTEQTGS